MLKRIAIQVFIAVFLLQNFGPTERAVTGHKAGLRIRPDQQLAAGRAVETELFGALLRPADLRVDHHASR